MPAPAPRPLPLPILLLLAVATASAAVPPAASHSQPTLPTKGAGASHSQPTKPAAPPSAALATAPPAEGALLAAFLAKADPTAHLRFPLAATPCAHPGVTCSGAAGITHLVLEQAGLNGTFAPDTLSGLAGLRVLSLKSNALHGPVPDLSALGNLKALFLAGNRFSGPFPASLASLRRLRSIDLSGNRFSGALPPGIEAAFPHLTALRLDSNHFNGSVPAWNQSSLKLLNVSYNDFSGPVPVTASMALMGADAFAGNPGLCGEVVRRECSGSPLVFFPGDGSSGSATPPAQSAGATGVGPQRQGLPGSSAPRAHKVKKKTAMTVAIALAAVLAVLLVCAIVAATRGKKRRRPSTAAYPSPKKSAAASQLSREMDNSDIGYVECVPDEEAAAMMMPEEKARRLGRSGCLTFCAGEATSYSLEQLMRASAEVLGRGSVGTTYKAVLDGRLVVIVKRLDAAKIGPAASEAETFEQNMDVIGRLRHPNLVPLRSFFQAKEERLLVYDYQPNGSLHSLIHGSRSSRGKPLHWTSCLKIAEDVAQGLAYIHQASRLVHGNIKSSNVLLGSDFEACLTDNCLSFLLESAEVKDDAAYRAPENMKSNRRLTPKSDVYAFGILLLELLSGKAPLEHSVLAATNLQTYALSGREDEGVDRERLSMIVDIASACVRSSPESRPTAWQVLKMIQEVKEADATGDNEDGDLDLTSDS
ncbi:probable inactive receptor kinase At5g67200 [Triticum dicoccoides]|uniref:probable inactive receptor kinase At5g67200 n=1 Tax=Triticum dicoccoides TaxID=85692 RepID=UPI0018906C81|nr:probable inactive receptor kinase At5g67200 [Triticum dicoccoides]